MDPIERLRALDLGEDVAEFDDRLTEYFVRTEAFRDLVEDRVDLLLGAKGSGKTALLRFVLDPHAAIDALQYVDSVPVLHAAGDVELRSTIGDAGVHEHSLRDVWLSYFVATAANHLIDYYDLSIPGIETIRRTAAELGVLIEDPSQHKRLFRTIVGHIAERTSVHFVGELGVPGAQGKLSIDAPARETQGSFESTTTVRSLLTVVDAFLERQGRSIWLLVDRLDEAFIEERSLERRALRSFLRSQIALNSLGSTLRVKAVLRDDLLSRVTSDSGFVNLTHLRYQTIVWDASSITRLIERRVERVSPEVCVVTSGETSKVGLLPPIIQGLPAIDWLISRSSASIAAPSPRNVLTLLRAARGAELNQPHVRQSDADEDPLLSPEALAAGYREVSHRRLYDTVYAERHSLRQFIELLRGGPALYTAEGLVQRLGLAGDSEEWETTLAGLIATGVLTSAFGERFSISPLYRPSLEVAEAHHTASHVGCRPLGIAIAIGHIAAAVQGVLSSSGRPLILPPMSPLSTERLLEILGQSVGVQGRLGTPPFARLIVSPNLADTSAIRISALDQDAYLPTGLVPWLDVAVDLLNALNAAGESKATIAPLLEVEAVALAAVIPEIPSPHAVHFDFDVAIMTASISVLYAQGASRKSGPLPSLESPVSPPSEVAAVSAAIRGVLAWVPHRPVPELIALFPSPPAAGLSRHFDSKHEFLKGFLGAWLEQCSIRDPFPEGILLTDLGQAVSRCVVSAGSVADRMPLGRIVKDLIEAEFGSAFQLGGAGSGSDFVMRMSRQ